MLSEPLEPSPLKFLYNVQSDGDIKRGLQEWLEEREEQEKKKTGKLRLIELKEQLFQPEEERQSSASLRSTAVLRAIEAERMARKRRLQRVRLEPIPVEEGPTTLIPILRYTENNYRVVIERGRAFSLEMTDSEFSTLSMMEVLSNRCKQLTGHYPTLILIRTERFLALPESIYQLKHFITRDGLARIPFDCAESSAEYDVQVVYDIVSHEDEWTKDRKD